MISIDRPLIVTDTETTGLSPKSNRIIEIAATRVSAGAEPVSFSELIDPGEPISYRITRLTGITTAMVYGCPTAAEVMPAFHEFLGEGILVAHNLSFDRGFINAERGRLGLEPMQNQGLCTVRLARRFLPGLRSKSLASLARFFRIPDHGRHRAHRDVEITVAVLERLLQIAANEHAVTELDELLAMQSRTYARINPFAKHIVHIRGDILPRISDSAGVYRMLDGRNKVLYVGKARVLSKRVRSYFNAIEAHPPRIRQLVASVRNISWTETPTELEALLLESRQIRELDPPFNRAQKRTTPRPYIRIDNKSPFPRVTSHVYPRDDDASYYGPFRSRAEARSIVSLIERYFKVATCDEREFSQGHRCLRADIGRCSAPCEGLISSEAYRAEVMDISGFLGGDVMDILARLQSEMALAAESLAFEDAARLRDLHDLIAGLIERQGRVAPEISCDDAVVLHRVPDGGEVNVIAIRSGRFHSSLAVPDPGAPDVRAVMEQFIEQAFVLDDTPLDPRADADQIRVLMHWLYAHRDDLHRFECSDYQQTDDMADHVVAQMRLQILSAVDPTD